ncbi:hypothetical protein PMG11_01972 [Penicillium brasilianum]|uniref:Hsp70 family chaperone n=1 Tax=Penicillium brasilianum TaxID=104259 RepID=A0A0F7TFZ8_PENBI|nr:hypothetical protein PMG11_01972 [Penicillium brasilianum]
MSATLHKIIVGVDFGTTFTGISWVDSSKKHLNDIDLIRSWPGPTREQDEVCKTPSRIAYKCENPSISNGAAWGYQVEARMKSYSWMKLLLDPKIYRYTILYLEKRLGAGVVQASPLNFWFTIPAMWSDKAKEDTLRVAIKAGFKSRPKDDITIITEPEAAAIATLTTLSDEENAYDVRAGDIILICDCGGGTVDIITYLVNQASPVFKFEELLVGIGGKCGSTFIDRNFQRWMARTFKSAWENLKPEKKGPGSRLMRDFEAAKRDFGTQGTLDKDKRYEIEFVIPNASDFEHYDADEGLVVFTRQASVVKGAALAALKNSRPQKRKSRLHYGVNVSKEFREGVDSEKKACYSDWDGRKMCTDRMMWIINKGDSIGKEDKLSYDLVESRFENQSLATCIRFYTYEDDCAPEWCDSSCRNVGKLCWEFKKSDLELFESKKHSNGQTMWQMAYSVVFDLFADKGVLQFKAIGPRNENLGEIAIEYSGASDQRHIGPQERIGMAFST